MKNLELRYDMSKMLRALRKSNRLYAPQRQKEEYFVKCSNGQDLLCTHVSEIRSLTKKTLTELLKNCNDDAWITINDVTDLDGYPDGLCINVMQEQKQSDESYYQDILHEYKELGIMNDYERIKLKAKNLGIDLKPFQITALMNEMKSIIKDADE